MGKELLRDILPSCKHDYLLLIKIHGLESKLMDFVLAFPQADLNVDIWIDFLIGFELIEDPYHNSQYVLKLHKNRFQGL